MALHFHFGLASREQLVFAQMTQDPCLARASPAQNTPLGQAGAWFQPFPSEGLWVEEGALLSPPPLFLQDKLENCLLPGFFFSILKVKADFLSLCSILPGVLSYSNILIATPASQLHIILPPN